MNGLCRIQIQNQHGRYMHDRFLGHTERIGALFSRREDAQYRFFDEDIRLTGWDSIDRHFRSLARSDYFVMAHTPVIRGADEGFCAQATWMATGFFVSGPDGAKTVEQRILRYDAQFVYEDGQWKYLRLDVYYFMSLLPEPFGGVPAGSGAEARGSLPPEPSPRTNAEDYLCIARIQGRWAHDRRRGMTGCFSRSPDCLLSLPGLLCRDHHGYEEVSAALGRLDALEQKNAGAYLSVVMTASPVIELDKSGGTARACWLGMNIGMRGPAFGNPLDACPVYVTLGRYDQQFVKENGEWKLLAFRFFPCMTLGPMRYSREKSQRGVIAFEGSNWLYAPAPSGALHADDALEIEDYVGWWTAGLRYRSEAPFYYRYLARERPELLKWTMLARRPGDLLFRVSTSMEDIDNEIFGMTDMFQTKQPKGPGFHCATTPVVEVSDDGLQAHAVWFDFGWTLQAEAFGKTEPPYPAEPGIARYEHRYVKVDGQWKLCQFAWFPLFRVQPWFFDYRITKGWAGSDSTKRFPLPFTPYEYSPRRRDPQKPFTLEPAVISCPRERQRGLTIGD